MGLYISYIHPRRFTFTLFNEDYTLKHSDKFIIVDLFMHILAFVFVYITYNKYYHNSFNIPFLLSLAIIIIYSILISTYHVYGIRRFELLAVFIIANLAYLLLFDRQT